jgi:hypothetical protein
METFIICDLCHVMYRALNTNTLPKSYVICRYSLVYPARWKKCKIIYKQNFLGLEKHKVSGMISLGCNCLLAELDYILFLGQVGTLWVSFLLKNLRRWYRQSSVFFSLFSVRTNHTTSHTHKHTHYTTTYTSPHNTVPHRNTPHHTTTHTYIHIHTDRHTHTHTHTHICIHTHTHTTQWRRL